MLFKADTGRKLFIIRIRFKNENEKSEKDSQKCTYVYYNKIVKYHTKVSPFSIYTVSGQFRHFCKNAL